MTEPVPPALQAAIRSDLKPVRPLPPPARRALPLAPLAALTVIAASSVFAFREDGARLGPLLTWGVSMAQGVLGWSLIALALRETIPGRTSGAPALLLAAGSVLGFSLVATLRTWEASATMIRPDAWGWVGRVCFLGTVASAVPLLAAAAWLAARAMVVRPWSVGALYGLGAGLGADAGWRLFCHYSDPAHVVLTHTGGVLGAVALGVVTAGLAARGGGPSAGGRSRS